MSNVLRSVVMADKTALLDAIQSGDAIPDETVITYQKLQGGSYHVLSRYGDSKWRFPDTIFPAQGTTNKEKYINFGRLRNQDYVAPLKLAINHYYLKGLPGGKRPKGATLIKFADFMFSFVCYLSVRRIGTLSAVSPLVAVQYAGYCKNQPGRKGQKASTSTVNHKLHAIEKFYTLLRGTQYSFNHPWPESSVTALSGWEKSITGKTAVIPDAVAQAVMQRSVSLLSQADSLIGYRNAVQQWQADNVPNKLINARLAESGHKKVWFN